MRIKYHATEEDYIAFNIFHSRHSPYAKRVRIIIGLIIPAILITIILLQAIYSRNLTSAVVGTIIFIGLSIWILAGKNRRIGRISRKMFREGGNKSFFGEHELEINDYGIITKSEYGEGKIAWAAIERIGATSDYVFIYTGSTKAIILPKAHIIEGSYEEFVTGLKSYYNKSSINSSSTSNIKQEKILIDNKPVFFEEKRIGKNSYYGIVSLLIAMSAILMIFMAFLILIINVIAIGDELQKNSISYDIFAIFVVFALFLAFIGTVFGIAGLFKKKHKKSLAIIGLIFNLLIFLGFISIAILAHSR